MEIPEPEFVDKLSVEMDFTQELVELPNKRTGNPEVDEALDEYWHDIDRWAYKTMLEDGYICRPCGEGNHNACEVSEGRDHCNCAELDHYVP